MPLSLENIQHKIQNNAAFALYSTSNNCGICNALKPKLFPFLEKNFPEIKIQEIQTKVNPEISAYYQVFTVPTVLIFFDGREYLRKSHAFGLKEIAEIISRPYDMIFDTKTTQI